MKNLFKFTFFALFILSMASCANGFEKIRTSDDTKLQYDKAFEFYENGDYLKARSLFEILLSTLRGKSESEKVYYYYAQTYYQTRNYKSSIQYFENFTQTFLNSQYREDAEFLMAMANYKLSPAFRLDQSFTTKSMNLFQAYINKYPQSEKVAEANTLIDEMQKKLERKAYEEGKLYRDRKMWDSAKQSLTNMIKDFPDSEFIEEARFMIAQSDYLIAENSIRFRQIERYEKAIEQAQFFKKKYPVSEYTAQVDKIISTSNDKLKELSK